MLVVVDDLDQYRQVRRELDETRRVDHAAGTKPRNAMDNRGTGESFRAKAFEQRAREWSMPPAIRFPEEDSNERLYAVKYSHGITHCPKSCLDVIRPSQPAAKHPTSVTAAFNAASPCAPSCNNRVDS